MTAKQYWSRKRSRETIRIFLVDGHKINLLGLRSLFDQQPRMTIVGDASDADAAVKGAAEHDPELIIINSSTIRFNSTTLAKELSRSLPDSGIGILSRSFDDKLFRLAIQHGRFRHNSSFSRLDELPAVIRSLY